MSIGMIITSALALGADTALTAVVTQAAKDAYSKFKSAVFAKAETTAKAVIESPESKTRAAALAEDIDGLPEAEKEELRRLANELIATLSSDPAAQRTFGLRIVSLNAKLVDVGKIDASENATAVEIGTVQTETFRVADVVAKGKQRGKA